MGTKIRCTYCNEELEGDKRGTFISCSCGKTAIDETPFYFSVTGDPDKIEIQDNEGNWKLMSEVNEKKEPEIPKRVDKINYYLNIAESVAERSTCLKRQYGAVIVKNDEIISTGYNGAPRKIRSCLDCGVCKRENSNRGEDYSHCTAVHAEQNAIISASRKDMIGADIYIVGKELASDEDLPWSYVNNAAPCSLCKRMIINAGIESVIIREDAIHYEIGAVKDWKEEDIIEGY